METFGVVAGVSRFSPPNLMVITAAVGQAMSLAAEYRVSQTTGTLETPLLRAAAKTRKEVL